MTATEVFIRFLKDNGFYSFIKPFIHEAYKHYLRYCDEKDIGGCDDMIAAILRASNTSINNIVYIIFQNGGYVNGVNKFGYVRYMRINRMFHIFLKERVKNNYMKTFIRYNQRELCRDKTRNGYHNLQFSIIKNPEQVKNVISYGRSNQHTYK